MTVKSKLDAARQILQMALYEPGDFLLVFNHQYVPSHAVILFRYNAPGSGSGSFRFHATTCFKGHPFHGWRIVLIVFCSTKPERPFAPADARAACSETGAR